MVYEDGKRKVDKPLRDFVFELGGPGNQTFDEVHSAWHNHAEHAVYVLGLDKYFIMEPDENTWTLRTPFLRDMRDFKGLARGIDAVVGECELNCNTILQRDRLRKLFRGSLASFVTAPGRS